MQRDNYILHLQEAIRAMHGVESTHTDSIPITSRLGQQIAWDGIVEVFELNGHPQAKRCYAWGYEENGQLHSTAVLELPPVDSPQNAVAASISAKAKKI